MFKLSNYQFAKLYFRPQLADRVPVAKLEKLFGGREFFIETKYDGERCQVHLLKGKAYVMLFFFGFLPRYQET